MLLRPATPLAVVLFAAFALMLLAVLSTPVIEAIPLGAFEDATFGVFGYCKGKDGCTSIGVGYDIEAVFRDKPNSFDLPDSVRGSLAPILIVHPVAAFLCLVMFVMAVTSHFHAPSHSARFLLIFFILQVVTFLICLLAFLVDILVFMPHMAWGTYVVLAATILVAFGGVVTCAMRRAMTSRKARRKKIEENAEMSGENYYNREANGKANHDMGVTSQPSIPLVSGANHSGTTDNLPAFASFEQAKKGDQISDERVPLTQRSPTSASNEIGAAGAVGAAAGAYGSRSPSRDRYGNPTNGPPDAYGRDPSFERSQSRGRGDMAGAMGGGYHRGRGGPYGGRGGYGPPSRGRGGYGPPGRGGYGLRGGRGGYPPPRGGYGPGGPMRGGRSPPPMYAGAGGAYARRPSNDSYAQEYSANQSTNPSSSAVNNYEPYNPDDNLARAESPPPLPSGPGSGPGTIPEMDAGQPRGGGGGYGQYGQLRDSDIDVAGMVGLQQGQAPGPGRHETYMSDGSKYSTDEQYVPPRQGWNHGSGRNSPSAPSAPSPLNVQARASPPAELPGRRTPTAAPAATGNYYEDVDPRFAEPSPSHLQPQQEPIYEDIHAASGSRSPAESERSTFTSISQRGVNPRWNPPPPMPGQGLYPPPQQQRRPQQQRQDMLLDNPDFQLPGGGGRAPSRGAGGGMIPGSAYPTGSI